MVEEAKQDAFVCLSNNPNLETFVYNDMIPGGKELDKFINSSSIATMMVGNANGPKSRGNVFRVKLRDESLSVSNFSITKDPDKYIYTVSDPDPDQNYPEYAIRLKLIGGKKYKVVPEDNKLILGDAATLTIVKNTTIGFYDAKIEIGGIVERQEPLCGYHLTIGRNDRDHIQLPDNEQTESISSFHLKLDYDPVTEEFTVIDWKDGTGSTYGTEMIIGEDDFIIDDYHLCDYIFRIGQKEASYCIMVMDESKKPSEPEPEDETDKTE